MTAASERREPQNKAIRKLWDHVRQCGEERKQEHADLKSAYEKHLDRQHHPPLEELAEAEGLSPEEMVSGFVQSVATTSRIVNFIEGPPVTHLDGSIHHDHSKGSSERLGRLEAGMVRVENQLHNGLKLKLGIKEKALIWVAAIGGVATVVAAIVG